MPLFFPLNGLQGNVFTDGVLLDGAGDVGFALTVSNTISVTFDGSGDLEFFHDQGRVGLDGSSDVLFALRLNSEPDVLPGVAFDGTSDVGFALPSGVGGGVLFDGSSDVLFSLTWTAATPFGFTFFVDIMPAALAAALASHTRRYSARLTVDGTTVPILAAQISAPPGALGTELRVTLARADVSQVSATSTISFDIGVWVSGAWTWINLITGGRMSERGAHYANQEGLPADAVEVAFVDVMGDRWNRRPNVPTTLYDPQIVDTPSVETISQETIYTAQGGPVAPLFQAIPGLTLGAVLGAAYVSGCGFSHVITNIDNYAVEEVTFSLTGGYDAAVRPLLAPYEPIVFVVGNDLWIVSLYNPLPAGFASRTFPASFVEAIDDQLPAHEPVNAMLARLKNNAPSDYYTERVESATESSGDFGTDSYTETNTQRRVREFRNFSTPTVIAREEEVSLTTTVTDSIGNEVSSDTRTNTFDALNRPTGYTHTQESLLPDPTNPDGDRILQTSLSETQTITYAQHPLYPNRDVQSRIETVASGLILTDPDNQYLGKDYKIPLHDAHKSGYVDPGGNQTTEFGALRTVIETLRVNGGQVVRDRRVINHVAGVEEPPTTQVLPGDASFDRRRDGQTRSVLLTISDGSTTPRRVEEFDATGLPYVIGFSLAQKRLARLNNPPRDISVNMPYCDPTMRRGIDLQIMGRSGAIGTYIVRGYSISISMNQEGVVEATMSLQARELQS